MFVYGTLKTGHGNNRVIFEHGGDGRLVGRATTRAKFFMEDGGFPKVGRLLKTRQPPLSMLGHVVGEVWEVNETSFENMDRLEGHPRFYTRVKTPCIIDGQDAPVTTWMYEIITNRLDQSRLIKPVNGKLEWHQKFAGFPRGWEFADA
jgi:gamma-glutamylcyclotransferase (GGCT)/AIG2-like uncharacterized protein YtfP